ncbi:MAG: arginine--tRNA ligase [Spirochaetes bacterium]|nr:arginine--tRNA ligase [Spirochaetota bacterium]
MTLKQHLSESLRASLDRLDLAPEQKALVAAHPVRVEYPEARFGDYASPVAMELARILKKNPALIAEQVVAGLPGRETWAAVDIVKPGFINFRLSDAARTKWVRTILETPTWGDATPAKKERVLLEFVSANPTGPLHVGHGRWAAIGDTLARVLRAAGLEVETEFYVNDAGVQIAKLKETVAAIRTGKEIPEGGYHGDHMQVFKTELGDPVEYFLAGQKATLAKVGTAFDRYFRETSLHQSGAVDKTIAWLKEHGHTYEQEGALWFRTTPFGDDKDRVLIKGDGQKTYFAVDIAYHAEKVRRGYDRLINIFGADHHGYQGRLGAAVTVLSEGRSRLDIVIGQLVSLFRDGEPVRMSKRTGDIVTLDEVVEEIGSDAARYFLGSGRAATPLEFDLALALKQESDNPVYYVQYAHARLASVLRKAGEEGIPVAASFDFAAVRGPHSEELAIQLIRFPEEIEGMAASLEIHHLATWLSGLAAILHRHYGEHRYVDAADREKSGQYLALVVAVKQVIARALGLLGVSAPEKM